MAKLLRESGVDFRRVDYVVAPLSREKLEALVRKMGVRPGELLRTREPAYREEGLDAEDVSEERILDALVRRPELLQRPIVERGDRAVLARPPERIRELLGPRDGRRPGRGEGALDPPNEDVHP